MKEKKSTDEYLSEMGYSLFDEYERAIELADIDPGDLVFDAATGSARMTRVLVEKGCQIVSGDIKREKLDAVKYAAPFSEVQNIHWLQLDLHQPCFRDGCLDNIVCANLFHEVRRPEAVLRQLLRIFSGKGKMVLLDFNEHGFSVVDEISQKRHGRGHTTKEIMPCGAIESFLEKGAPHFHRIDLSLNWVYVISSKR